MLAVETQNLHPATLLCLEALEHIHDRLTPRRILDMGCGNGILALTAAGIWPQARVLAADISENAVEAARAAGCTEAVRSDGFSNPAIADGGPYDLIFCNLLAETVQSMAENLKKSLSKGGFLIVSGLLAWKAPEIERHTADLGLEIEQKFEHSPWACHLLRHKSDI